MNRQMANTAINRIRGALGIRRKNNCQRWVREATQDRYGERYDALWQASARLTAEAWIEAQQAGRLPAGVQVILSSDPADTQPGDLLYRRRGDAYGHVGIRTWDNLVAENSSYHAARRTWRHEDGTEEPTHGALGCRLLSNFRFDTIVRLPEISGA